MRALATAVLVVLAWTLITGCGGHVESAALPVQFDSAQTAPLGANSVEGGMVAYRPHRGPAHWQVSFGSFSLCVRTHGTPARILSVRPRVDHRAPPAAVEVWLRQVTPGLVSRTSAVARRRWLTGFYSNLGAPPRFDQGYGSFPAPGDYTRTVAGTIVTLPCREMGRDWEALPRELPPKEGLQELIFTLDVGPRGGGIEGADIRYEIGGKQAILRMRWHMTACGSAIHDHRSCPPDARG